MSAVAWTLLPHVRHFTIRTTFSSGHLEYSTSDPWSSEKRVWHARQTNRKSRLFLPIRSPTRRFP